MKKLKNVKNIKLPVSAPFHCRLMEPARKVMEKALNDIEFNTPLIPIISNISASPETDPIILKKNLIDQVTGTVKWRQTMDFAKNIGMKKITELGSGKVLTGIAKRMLNNISAESLENPEDYNNIL